MHVRKKEAYKGVKIDSRNYQNTNTEFAKVTKLKKIDDSLYKAYYGYTKNSHKTQNTVRKWFECKVKQ